MQGQPSSQPIGHFGLTKVSDGRILHTDEGIQEAVYETQNVDHNLFLDEEARKSQSQRRQIEVGSVEEEAEEEM
jgi:hypothetical protein